MEEGKSAVPTRKLADLKPNMPLQGRITRIELFGAFVDVGAEREGLVHISRLKHGHVNRVEDVVQVGQDVEVWVLRVDPDAGRLELTMIRPVKLRWRDIKPGMQLKGNVVRLENFGAFIDVGAERPGLVHVSQMSTDYVSDPREIVKLGEEVDVSVIDVDRKKRQMRLSMKPAVAEEALAEETPEELLPTAMEVALRRALEETDERQKASERIAGEGPPTDRLDQEDILSRTLRERVTTSSSRN